MTLARAFNVGAEAAIASGPKARTFNVGVEVLVAAAPKARVFDVGAEAIVPLHARVFEVGAEVVVKASPTARAFDVGAEVLLARPNPPRVFNVGAEVVALGPPVPIRAFGLGGEVVVGSVQLPDPVSPVVPNPTAYTCLNLLDDLPPFERTSRDVQGLLGAIGCEIGRVEAARADVIQSFFPATSGLLLAMFEEILGLPGAASGLSLADRQQQVLAFMRRLKSQGTGVEWEATVTSLVGSGWTYQEHDPAVPSSPAAYTVLVRLPYTLGPGGDRSAVALALLRSITPAHISITVGLIGGFIIGVSEVGIDAL